jgi:hypothetical protein
MWNAAWKHYDKTCKQFSIIRILKSWLSTTTTKHSSDTACIIQARSTKMGIRKFVYLFDHDAISVQITKFIIRINSWKRRSLLKRGEILSFEVIFWKENLTVLKGTRTHQDVGLRFFVYFLESWEFSKACLSTRCQCFFTENLSRENLELHFWALISVKSI